MATKTPAVSPRTSVASSPESLQSIAKKMLDRGVALSAANRPLHCPEIRNYVTAACADGHSRGVTVEKLIIELKDVWKTSADSASSDKAEVISRLVTMCIVEFYRTHSAPTRADAPRQAVPGE